MVKRDRCTESGYSLIEVITVLALVGLVVGLAFGAYSFVVKAYARGSDKHCSRKQAVVFSRNWSTARGLRLSAQSSSGVSGFFLETYSAEMRFWWVDGLILR